MQHEPPVDPDDQSPEPSRDVRNPTRAEPGDEAVYQAADPVPEDEQAAPEPDRPGGGGTTERASAEVTEAADSEPDRSE